MKAYLQLPSGVRVTYWPDRNFEFVMEYGQYLESLSVWTALIGGNRLADIEVKRIFSPGDTLIIPAQVI